MKKTATKATKRYVIVRSDMAGVHFGELVSSGVSGGFGFVVMRNSIRLWEWDSVFTLSELAVLGVRKAEDCKFSLANPGLVSIFGCCEIIDTTKASSVSIRAVKALAS